MLRNHLPDSAWIDANVEKPPLIDGQDYSENVWGWDGNDKRLLVVNYYNDSEGWFCGNCYGNIFGDAEFDDDYNITHWMPIEMPEPPKLENE